MGSIEKVIDIEMDEVDPTKIISEGAAEILPIEGNEGTHSKQKFKFKLYNYHMLLGKPWR